MSRVSTSCQYGDQRSAFDRSHVCIQAAVQQESLFPLGELLLSLLNSPAAEMHPLLASSSVLSPGKRLHLCLSYVFTGQSCYIHPGGEVRKGQQAGTWPVSPEGDACHFTFSPFVFISDLET
uniref:Uncharacterized protein n=1 Tax=Pipistrellus kuhlii TaxID=59472 RepID=A0A7J7XV63_PIPKU|nr:hypothetical protein mPipKuh1_010491 [Pipistrellus kuhlii]